MADQRPFDDYFAARAASTGPQPSGGDEILVLRSGTVFRSSYVFTRGYASMEGNAVATPIGGVGTWEPIGGTLLLGPITPSLTFAANAFTYVGPNQLEPTFLAVSASLLRAGGGGDDKCGLGIFVNGVLVGTAMNIIVDQSETRHISCRSMVALETGDVIDVRVRNASDPNDITCEDLQFVIGQ